MEPAPLSDVAPPLNLIVLVYPGLAALAVHNDEVPAGPVPVVFVLVLPHAAASSDTPTRAVDSSDRLK